MAYDEEVLKIFEKLKIFQDLYEEIRFIDPLKKKTLLYKDEVLTENNSNCYTKWRKDKLCTNCTSMRAFNENKTFIKMEHNLNKIYMVTSIPFKLSDRNVVIELLKDATVSMGFDSCENSNESDMYKTIDSMNDILLKDPLTNAYNRRYINEVLPVDLIMSSILNQNLWVIITDIDLFKDVNDTYGHLAGDAVLKEFTKILNQCIKDNGDWIARYGGEEFLISMHNSTQEKAITLAEQMRTSIEHNVFHYDDMKINITASFGISSIHKMEKMNIISLIDSADKKLYQAKHNGRNRVEF